MNAAKFYTNALVRVVAQPHSLKSFGELVGKVGYIEELSSDGSRALFQGVTLDGRFNGMGWIPIKCLVFESSAIWRESYTRFQNWIIDLNMEAQERQKDHDTHVQKIASQYGLTVENVLEISEAVKFA